MFINKSNKKVYIIKGDDESIENFFKAINIFSKVKDIKIQKLEFKGCDILSELTSNQKKILNYAREFGYYDYPRKITSEELSKKIGLKKDFTLENLRKAEKRIIARILEDN